MDKIIDKNYIDNLNDNNKSTRINNLKKIKKLINTCKLKRDTTNEVNNHVHTSYSFSPYSPTKAIYKAYAAGLKAVGIVDHDSISGCSEFIKAGKILNIPTTIGFELRVNFNDTLIEGKKINNPDSKNIAYIAFHGIPHNKIRDVKNFLKPVKVERNKRNIKMTEKLNQIIKEYSLDEIDFKKDIYNQSMAAYGGSITERHILKALSKKIIEKFNMGTELVNFLSKELKIKLSNRVNEYLLDLNNPYYIYDLIGVLKSNFIEKIFIQPNYKECIPVYEAVSFGNSINAITSYAYLGDITDSPTGDKKTEKFEDDFLDELFEELKRIGFKGITYMPPRNTLIQLDRVESLCKKYEFIEISGVDINSARQSFNCPIILEDSFKHLIDTTWALIAHEKLATYNKKYALFNIENPYSDLSVSERINRYSAIGKEINNGSSKNIKVLIDKK